MGLADWLGIIAANSQLRYQTELHQTIWGPSLYHFNPKFFQRKHTYPIIVLNSFPVLTLEAQCIST